MVQYEVGKVYPDVIGHTEGCVFDIADDGGTIIVYFYRPNLNEIQNFKADTRFELRLVEFSNVMMFLAKFGTLNWMDLPYNPHLSKNLTHFEEGPGGLAVTIMLFDTHTGKLEALRLVSLSESFTEKIRKASYNLLNVPFDRQSYGRYLSSIFERYSTDDIVKLSSPGYKIN